MAKSSAIYAQQINNSRDVAPSTANRRVIALRGFLKFLVDNEYIAAESIPQEGLKTKKTIITILVNTGVRVGE